MSSVNYETERKLFVEAWGDTKHGSMSSCIIMFPCAEIYNFVVGHCLVFSDNSWKFNESIIVFCSDLIRT